MPDWKAAVAARLARLAQRPAREDEIIDELAQHLDDRYLELRAGGVDHDEAMRLALDEIDDQDLLSREMQTVRRPPAQTVAAGDTSRGVLNGAWQDIVYAARRLRSDRLFAVAAIATLALGIGVNTAIFSVVNAALFQRLPVQNRDRLAYVYKGTGAGSFSFPEYRFLSDGATLLDGATAWGPITASLHAAGETDVITGAIVTGNYFDLLGVPAERGRLLGPADDVTPMAHPVAVLSYRAWQRRFGGRADIVGHEIRLNGQPFTLVGVAPRGFPGAELRVHCDLYVPMMMQSLMRPPSAGYSGEMNPDLLKNPNNGWLQVLVLPKAGIAHAQVQAELQSLDATFFTEALKASQTDPRRRTINLIRIDDGDPNQRRQLQSAAALLGSVVGVILLIACANVANLLLSKAVARRREVAIRLALGANRWRIVRQLLIESVMLALIGGSGGLLIAWMVVEAFQAAPPPPRALPVTLDFAVNERVVLFSLLVSIVTGLAFGLIPALQTSRPGLVPALKDGEPAAGNRRRRLSLKAGLVIAEVALSVFLLIASGLFLRSLFAVQRINPGVAAAELVSAPLSVNLLRYTKFQGRAFYQRVLERMQQLPGVRSASVARMALLAGGARITGIAIEGRPNGNDSAFANVVGPRFFDTMGIELIRGRDFTPQDLEDRPLVVIVNETMAQRYFPGEDVLGKRFSTGFSNASGQWAEIVGLVRDSKYISLSETPVPTVYMPLSQRHETGVTLYVRSVVPPATLIPLVRREIQSLEPNLPVPQIQSMDTTIGTSLYAPRAGAALMSAFGGLALVLASLGVYGVLAFSISRRTRELGIRIALGATRRGVFGLVVREGMTLVGIGLAIGLIGALYASRLIERFLFGVSVRDATAFAAGPLVLVAIALVACYVPARRATRVDPLVALRAE